MTHRHSLWAELRDLRRSTQRAVGTTAIVVRYTPPRRGCGIPPIMITPIGHHDRSEATRVVG